MRLAIDPDKCTGHGRCYTLVPALFEPDDYGHGHVVENLTPEEINEQDAWTAVRACPEQAVTFEQ